MNPRIYRQSVSLMMRATYLYYEKGYSQSDIAKEFDISVSTVSRLLNNAKKENMVSFVVDEKVMDVATLEDSLKEKFGLRDVVISRNLENYPLSNDDIKKMVAFEAAQYIQRIINDNDILGITMGRTVHHMIKMFNPCKKTNTQFVTLHGSIAKIHRDFNVDTLVERMAMSFGGKNYAIKAPGHAKSAYEADMLRGRVDNSHIFEMFKNVNISVSGVGSFYPEKHSYLCAENYFTESEIADIDAHNVYADIGLRLIDINGNECDTVFKKKTVGISYEDLKNIPTKIIMASGAFKKDSIMAVIRGKLVDVLIIDYELAKELENCEI